MQGKIAVVTGGNSGIGLATVIGLAQQGARVVMVARSREKGEAALAEAQKAAGSRAIQLMLCDLAVQADIRRFAAELLAQHPTIDVLVNNAAIIPPTRTLTPDGLEMQFAVNHLSYFLLSHLLLDAITAAPQGRIVNVSSLAHEQGILDFDDLQHEKRYHMASFPVAGWQAYANTKLMNILFTRELARRLAGTRVTTNALHPGIIATNLTRTVPRWFNILFRLVGTKPTKGAETSLYLATGRAGGETTGGYFAAQKPARIAPAGLDDAAAARLWAESARLARVEAVTA
jgi:NAD(P)-dependent dehydrogenase (short-subunit alcohol dehydrogenase family)